jgi:hypothetical protein
MRRENVGKIQNVLKTQNSKLTRECSQNCREQDKSTKGISTAYLIVSREDGKNMDRY